ncbi:unnamed protein product [Acanthosepion pharaonis]|uniref:Uncharacterized protein n=1 Tax=Acanthosepion pharaonis TaxID=158019 RepID=A0A812DUR1_ACAPH|nr:unnamed protein product [Sepia pharaonis]
MYALACDFVTQVHAYHFFFRHAVLGFENSSPHNQTVNRELHCDILRRLRKDVRRKQPDLWRRKELDSVRRQCLHPPPSPTSLHSRVSSQTKYKIVSLPHLPYSPNLAPVDLHLFSKLKMQLGERRRSSTRLRKTTFRLGSKKRQERWDRCIAAQGDYFEGDNVKT